MRTPSKKEIAEWFSNGQFGKAMDFLNEEIVWGVVGENIFKGKASVQQNCEQTAAYFNSVQTDFTTDDVIVSDHQVIVIGTAEFKRDGNRFNFISACDVYKFNEASEIIKISSYCIPEKK